MKNINHIESPMFCHVLSRSSSKNVFHFHHLKKTPTAEAFIKFHQPSAGGAHCLHQQQPRLGMLHRPAQALRALHGSDLPAPGRRRRPIGANRGRHGDGGVDPIMGRGLRMNTNDVSDGFRCFDMLWSASIGRVLELWPSFLANGS